MNNERDADLQKDHRETIEQVHVMRRDEYIYIYTENVQGKGKIGWQKTRSRATPNSNCVTQSTTSNIDHNENTFMFSLLHSRLVHSLEGVINDPSKCSASFHII